MITLPQHIPSFKVGKSQISPKRLIQNHPTIKSIWVLHIHFNYVHKLTQGTSKQQVLMASLRQPCSSAADQLVLVQKTVSIFPEFWQCSIRLQKYPHWANLQFNYCYFTYWCL